MESYLKTISKRNNYSIVSRYSAKDFFHVTGDELKASLNREYTVSSGLTMVKCTLFCKLPDNPGRRMSSVPKSVDGKLYPIITISRETAT